MVVTTCVLAPGVADVVRRQKGKVSPLEVQGDTVTVVRKVPFKVVAPSGGTLYDWTFPDGIKASADENVLTVIACPKGTFTIRARILTIDFDKKLVQKTFGEVEVNYGGVTPGPGPGPEPEPEPGPKPIPAPIGLPGYAALMVYETKTATELPPAQQNVLYGKKVRDWLKTNCLKDNDNPNGAFRIYDKDVDVSAESKAWQEVMKRDRKSVPWIVISNPAKGGYEGPLPANEDECIALLEKYKGVKK